MLNRGLTINWAWLMCLFSLYGAACYAGNGGVSIPDLVAPKISHQPNAPIARGESAVISAKVTDNRGVKSVSFYYRGDHEKSYQVRAMHTHGNTGIYTVSLDQPDASIVYYIEAKDGVGNKAFSGSRNEPLRLTVNEPAVDKTLAESLGKTRKKSTSRWVWVVVGALVSGGVVAALNSGDDKNGGGGPQPSSDGAASLNVTAPNLGLPVTE